MDVLVLSTGFEPMYLIGWSKALGDFFKGRVEIVKYCDTRTIGTTSGPVKMPSVVRFKEGVFSNKWKNRRKFIKLNRKTLWLRDKGKCQYCKITVGMKFYQIEHVIPKSRGGKTTWENVVVACPKCNQKKGSKTPQEAGLFLCSIPAKPTVGQISSIENKEIQKYWNHLTK